MRTALKPPQTPTISWWVGLDRQALHQAILDHAEIWNAQSKHGLLDHVGAQMIKREGWYFGARKPL